MSANIYSKKEIFDLDWVSGGAKVLTGQDKGKLFRLEKEKQDCEARIKEAASNSFSAWSTRSGQPDVQALQGRVFKLEREIAQLKGVDYFGK